MKTIRLTRENLHMLSGSPGSNGFTKKQVELLGFTWPPKKGWLSSLIGREITLDLYQEVSKHYRHKWAHINDPLGKVEIASNSGMPFISFKDAEGEPCVLELSDAILAPEPERPIGSWAVILGSWGGPMHISRDQVRKLISHLQSWLETGEL